MNFPDNIITSIKLPRLLNPVTIAYLTGQWRKINHEKTSVVIIEGVQDRFCLGMDLDWINTEGNTMVEEYSNQFAFLLREIHSSPLITLAIVDGEVMGGGLGLCAACDLCIGSTESSFKLSEGLIGLTPGIILPTLLNRLTKQAIMKMVFTAKKFSATEAMNMQLIDAFSPRNELDKLKYDWIHQILKCKKQSVVDLKNLLQDNDSPPEEIMQKGIQILMTRLGEEETKIRLSNLGYFNQQ
jgi:enoyl-CoA hydratase/carnithine racemase